MSARASAKAAADCTRSVAHSSSTRGGRFWRAMTIAAAIGRIDQIMQMQQQILDPAAATSSASAGASLTTPSSGTSTNFATALAQPQPRPGTTATARGLPCPTGDTTLPGLPGTTGLTGSTGL